MVPDMLERSLVERSLFLAHLPPEIHDPLARRAAGQVHAVDPGLENVRIGPPVRIGRKAQPFPREIARNVERPALRVAHEGDPHVRRDAPRSCQVDPGPAAPGREVGMDFVRGFAVEARLRPVPVVGAGEADQRDPHRRAVDHPRLVRPRIEDRASFGRDPQGPAVRAAADRVGGNKADTLCLPAAICSPALTNQ